MSDPGWPRAETTEPSAQPQSAHAPLNVANFESDFAELAAKFAAHGGDSFPADLSAELALEIVLNEIVEQACLATGATGAAVVLERDGEMVCRASSGPTAPELGARLDVASGLSRECIRTGLRQRCDDTQTDPRADAAASERLGVRSALVMPLVGSGGVVGLFQVFSPRSHAFGDRDERTLEVLVERVMKNLERAAEPLESLLAPVAEAPAEAAAEDVAVSDPPAEDLETAGAADVSGEQESAEIASASPSRRVDFVGWTLGAVVLACTLLLIVLIVQRFGGHRFRLGSTHSRTATGARVERTSARAASGVAGSAMSDASGLGAKGASGRTAATAPVSGAAKSAPAGSLVVFENGKEVFRMPPTQGQGAQPSTGKAVEPRASPERVVALSPAAAESSLIHRVEPDYPEEARERQLQGAVVLDIHIGQDGAVQDAKLVSGEPLLADAAVAAVRQWRFQPRIIDGAAVEMQTTVTLNFRLSN
jgi:TonB family protein